MSTTNNNAPFYVGQRVVTVRSVPSVGLVKDREHKILGIKKCGCGNWRVSIGDGYGIGLFCGYCLTHHDDGIAHLADHFAPANPSYSDATQSILEQFRKDEAVKDKCDSPVKEIINQ